MLKFENFQKSQSLEPNISGGGPPKNLKISENQVILDTYQTKLVSCFRLLQYNNYKFLKIVKNMFKMHADNQLL